MCGVHTCLFPYVRVLYVWVGVRAWVMTCSAYGPVYMHITITPEFQSNLCLVND